MSFYGFKPYVSVAAKRAQAAKTVEKLAKKGGCAPVVIAGKTISASFWGKAWCKHIEGWQDFENRLPRGRSYVRAGSVVDLRLEPGKIIAKVQGSSLYTIEIKVALLPADRWAAFKGACLGKVESMLHLLQGKLPEDILRQLTSSEDGLFPRSGEMDLGCSCPDWADMCKHVAAVLYGVGSRLDTQPELLFHLRGVDHTELLTQAAESVATGAGGLPMEDGALKGEDLEAIFGIELAEAATAAPIVAASKARGGKSGTGKVAKVKAEEATVAPKTAARVKPKAVKPKAKAAPEATPKAKKVVIKAAPAKTASKKTVKGPAKRAIKKKPLAGTRKA